MVLQAEIFENNTTSYTKSLYQHDKNVTLVFDGIDLPEEYEVHFSNTKDGQSISVACKGNENGVKIPNELLSTGLYVYAWVCDAGEETGSATTYAVVIPVIPRPIPLPVNGSSSDSDDSGNLNYEIDADGENLTFFNGTGIIRPNIEEEN